MSILTLLIINECVYLCLHSETLSDFFIAFQTLFQVTYQISPCEDNTVEKKEYVFDKHVVIETPCRL